MKKLLVAAAGVCALAVTGTAAPAHVVTLRVGDKVTLAGTSLHCAVERVNGKPAAVCFKLSANAVAVGSYSIVVSDAIAVVGRYVDKSGRNKPVFVKRQPRIGAAGFPSAGKGGKTHTFRLGDIAMVAGSHVAIAAEPNGKKQKTLGALLADKSLTPIAGSYGGGVSATEVVLARVTKSGSSSPLFRRTHGV